MYISPEREVNAGLWTLFSGASVFLGLRLYVKLSRRTGLWYDDYILIASWLVLMVTDMFITIEYALGYVSANWDDRMHILINISSIGTLIGQAWSKTAFGVTLLRMSNRKQSAILWFCIGSMNIYMIVKVFFQWAKYCGKSDYQNWYRLQGPCINYNFEENFKVGGNTYNIIMDFIFAVFPWWITWGLEMRRAEKIGLCFTMSLGMLVAVISAVRTSWKDRPIMHVHDEYYMWRNGMSNIWYSAEVAGTIIVQCIPILRPFLRDIHTSMTSKRLDDTENGRSRASVTWRSNTDTKRNSGYSSNAGDGKKHAEIIALSNIPEEPRETLHTGKESYSSGSPSDTENSTPTIPAGPLFGDTWRLSDSEHTDTEIHTGRSGYQAWIEAEHDLGRGLSPPPRRTPRL